MTRRKKLTLLLLFVTGLGLGGFATLEHALRLKPGVTLENFNYLGRCTSLNDVESLMGCQSAECGNAIGSMYTERGRVTHYRTWYGDGVKIVISFNKDDLVCYGIAWGSDDTVLRLGLRDRESLLDTIKSLLHL